MKNNRVGFLGCLNGHYGPERRHASQILLSSGFLQYVSARLVTCALTSHDPGSTPHPRYSHKLRLHIGLLEASPFPAQRLGTVFAAKLRLSPSLSVSAACLSVCLSLSLSLSLSVILLVKALPFQSTACAD